MKLWDDLVLDAESWSTFFFGYCCKNELILHSLWLKRLIVTRYIVSAMQHSHAKNIIYLDLKPDNIGFDNNCGLSMLYYYFFQTRIFLNGAI